ncbi:MAG: class I SAM-dependent methyltransferase [Bythopirellula sp.]|nr:class I SAM-dependent methyltransferase [Bythopirellula sp.]
MNSSLPNYELLDFGGGRKLERFGEWVLDRPAPGADKPVARPDLWKSATARYEGSRTTEGDWLPAAKKWRVASGEFRVHIADDKQFQLLLSALPSGQVGVFPEQLESWEWVAKQVLKLAKPQAAIKILNLFAYTGGSTLAAACAGAEVTHVDAAKGMVARARENAAASGLADAPIRWIVEDAVKFCEREVKRGNYYDAVILDPPTYGHGPKGEAWSIKRDLLPLLSLCRELTVGRLKFALCTCHTPGIDAPELSAYLSEGIFGHCGQPPRTGTLFLETVDGRKLPSGIFARWPG